MFLPKSMLEMVIEVESCLFDNCNFTMIEKLSINTTAHISRGAWVWYKSINIRRRLYDSWRLSVCLVDGEQKNLKKFWTDFNEIFRHCWQWSKEQMKVKTLTVGLQKIVDHRDLIIKQPTVLPYVTAGVSYNMWAKHLLDACLRSLSAFLVLNLGCWFSISVYFCSIYGTHHLLLLLICSVPAHIFKF